MGAEIAIFPLRIAGLAHLLRNVKYYGDRKAVILSSYFDKRLTCLSLNIGSIDDC